MNGVLNDDYEVDLKLIVLKIIQQVTFLDDYFIDLVIGQFKDLPLQTIRLMDHSIPEISFQALKTAGNLLAYCGNIKNLSQKIIEAGFLGKI